jgi:hypothetical protein
MHDRPLLIEPYLFHLAVTDKSLFSLGTTTTSPPPLFLDLPDLDFIDFMYLNGTSYIRLRNYHPHPISLSSPHLIDDNLLIHCLSRRPPADTTKTPNNDASSSQFIMDHRRIERYH